jgi:hypothetical protein
MTTATDARDITELLQTLDQLPMCAVCQAPCEALYVDSYVWPDGEPWHIVFAAFCHGDVETASFNVEEWVTIIPGTAQFGWAFRDPLAAQEGQWPTD